MEKEEKILNFFPLITQMSADYKILKSVDKQWRERNNV